MTPGADNPLLRQDGLPAFSRIRPEHVVPAIDHLLPAIHQELDPAERQAMIDKVHGILKDDVVYAPLHVQPLVWVTKAHVELQQRPDNFLILRWVRVN